jgi:hypothetical protein
MKKIIAMIAMMAITTAAFSQFGVQAGANMSTFSDGLDNKAILGYQVGFFNTLGQWGDRLSIEPGLILIHKGGTTGNTTTHLNYLQVPLNTKINFYIGEAKLYLGYGIYGACGIWGNTKIDKTKTEIDFGNENIRRFDVGGQVMIGLISGRMGLDFAFQPGARSLYKNGSRLNTSYMLSYRYLFSDPRN